MGFNLFFLDNKPEWTRAVERLPADQQDIHFRPEYAQIYSNVYGHRPFLAVLEDGDELVAQPFVERSLQDLPFLVEARKNNPSLPHFFDIANPYGYGGPVLRSSGDPIQLLKRFESELVHEASERGWASEFSSVHPLVGHSELLKAAGVENVAFQKQVVVIDLKPTHEEIWGRFDKGHKSSIKKAQKSGVVVNRVPTSAENLATFHSLYIETMRRRGAAARWHFPDNFFEQTSQCLGENGASLFFAFYEGMVIGCYFLIHAFRTAYLHFSAADAKWLKLSPNNLLMHETMLWAKESGYEIYHLGGGVTSLANDPLFSFKAGFSGQTVDLSTYFRILNETNYRLLCEMKKAYERSSTGAESNDPFFPLYRR